MFHAFCSTPRSAASERLARFRCGNLEMRLHYIEDDWADVPISPNFPTSSYLRLSLPALLPDEDRVLYLDGDIVILDDVAKLFDMSLGGKPIGAMVTLQMIYRRHAKGRISTSGFSGTLDEYLDQVVRMERPDEYVNTGILLLDLKRLRKQDFTSKVRADLMANGHRYAYADQDGINALMQGKIKLLDPRWHVYGAEFGRTDREKVPDPVREISMRSRQGARLIHFAGPKPWQGGSIAAGPLWWRYADMSPAGRELRDRFGNFAYPALVAPPPRWARWIAPIATARYWLRRLRRSLLRSRGRRIRSLVPT